MLIGYRIVFRTTKEEDMVTLSPRGRVIHLRSMWCREKKERFWNMLGEH